MRTRLLAGTALIGLLLGAVIALLGSSHTANVIWAAVIVLLIVPETIAVIRTLLSRRLGVDSIALLAMATALVMGEYLAGAVVALMLSGGNALEDWAAGRSRRELRALLARAPSSAHLIEDGRVREVSVSALRSGDVVAVRSGEVLPVDGLLLADVATLDESALTGESLPVEHTAGAHLRSGTMNAGDAFELRATESAANSSYQRLIGLVRSAETDRAPFVRMADRWAVWLLLITLLIGGLAWVLSGDSVRFLAVLVVATPCPLILAAPIAFIAGISRAAARGVIVKSGGAVEALGRARAVLLDKTGTLTHGDPRIDRIAVHADLPEDTLLRLVASLEQLSTHVLAASLVRASAERSLQLSVPTQASEVPGEGMVGVVDEHQLVVGSARLLENRGVQLAELPPGDGRHASVHVAADGRHVGTIMLADELRSDAAGIPEALHGEGVARVVMLTGDHEATALHVAERAGITEVRADQSPQQKLEAVKEFQADPDSRPVVMVGDGINDAPALAAADVGIAMSTAGETASTEAADVVVTVPEVSRVVEAIAIGRRSHGIALESVLVGIGLSVGAMFFAAFGLIPPVAGALLQEVIDVAVILNALRALR